MACVIPTPWMCLGPMNVMDITPIFKVCYMPMGNCTGRPDLIRWKFFVFFFKLAFPDDRDYFPGLKKADHYKLYSWQEVKFADNHVCLEEDRKTQMGPRPNRHLNCSFVRPWVEIPTKPCLDSWSMKTMRKCRQNTEDQETNAKSFHVCHLLTSNLISHLNWPHSLHFNSTK